MDSQKNLFFGHVRIPATSYLVLLFTLIYIVLFHLLPLYYLDVPCYLNNRQRYCSVWSEREGLFPQEDTWQSTLVQYEICLGRIKGGHNIIYKSLFPHQMPISNIFFCLCQYDVCIDKMWFSNAISFL